MNGSLATLVKGFAANSQQSGRAMRELAERDPGGFLAQAVDILRAPPKGAGLDYVLMLLAQGDYLLEILWHEDLLTEAQAVEVMVHGQKLDRQLPVRMARRLSEGSASTGACSVGRILEILSATADATLLPLLLPLANHANKRIRSKVALVIGRVNHNAKWAESRLADPDARVRANAVESMWGVDTAEARALLWKASQDPHHRVEANASLGLYRLGEPAGIKLLIQMSNRDSTEFRAAAVWAMGECRDPRALPRLRELANDATGQLRNGVTKATARIEERLRLQSEASPLRVRMVAWREHTGDRRELWVAATTLEGITLPGLRPTAFAILEDGHLVTDYAVQESRQQRAMVVGLALPHSAASATPNPLAAALAESLHYKRRLDQWALARYLPETDQRRTGGQDQSKQSHDRLFGVDLAAPARQAKPAPEPAEEPVDCVVSNSSAAIKLELGRALSRRECAAGLDAAINNLLNVVSRRPGTGHIIVLASSAQDCHGLAETYHALAEQAQSLSIRIHAVAGPDLPANLFDLFRKLAHKTGGRALRASATKELSDVVTTLYLSLAHHYRIAYDSANGQARPSRVQISVQTTSASGDHEVDDMDALDRPTVKTPTPAIDQPATSSLVPA